MLAGQPFTIAISSPASDVPLISNVVAAVAPLTKALACTIVVALSTEPLTALIVEA